MLKHVTFVRRTFCCSTILSTSGIHYEFHVLGFWQLQAGVQSGLAALRSHLSALPDGAQIPSQVVHFNVQRLEQVTWFCPSNRRSKHANLSRERATNLNKAEAYPKQAPSMSSIPRLEPVYARYHVCTLSKRRSGACGCLRFVSFLYSLGLAQPALLDIFWRSYRPKAGSIGWNEFLITGEGHLYLQPSWSR